MSAGEIQRDNRVGAVGSCGDCQSAGKIDGFLIFYKYCYKY